MLNEKKDILQRWTAEQVKMVLDFNRTVAGKLSVIMVHARCFTISYFISTTVNYVEEIELSRHTW